MRISKRKIAIAAVCSFLFFTPNAPLQAQMKAPPDVVARQRQAVAAMPSVKVSYNQKGTVSTIEGVTGLAVSRRMLNARKGDSGEELLAVLKDVLAVSGAEELTVISNKKFLGTKRTLRFSQSIAGIPVISGVVSIGVESSTGVIDAIGMQFLPDRDLPRSPKLTAQEAQERAREAVYSILAAQPESARVSSNTTLAYVGSHDLAPRAALVWVVPVEYVEKDGAPAYRNIWIDAINGEYLGQRSNQVNLTRTVYTANGATPPREYLPQGTTQLFTEGNPSGTDVQALTAYLHVGTARDALLDYIWAWQDDVPELGIVVRYGSGLQG